MQRSGIKRLLPDADHVFSQKLQHSQKNTGGQESMNVPMDIDSDDLLGENDDFTNRSFTVDRCEQCGQI